MSSQLATQHLEPPQDVRGSTDAIADFEQLDAEPILQAVQETELPPRVAEIAEAYERRIGTRSSFVWQWIYKLFPEFTLSCVSPAHARSAREAKTLLTIYITTLDDIAENEGDEATFEAGQRLPLLGSIEVAGADEEALDFLETVWAEIEDLLTAAPRYDEFEELFRYDIQQTFNAMRYSLLVSDHPEIANLDGSYRYGQHNMVMFAYADVDLCYSTGFDPADFSGLRRTIWGLQPMARIGNWVTTWERELHEGDYSSGVVVSALDQGIVSTPELEDGDTDVDELVDRIREAGVEAEFIEQWKRLFARIDASDLSARSVDLEAFVAGMRTVMRYHLATRGYK